MVKLEVKDQPWSTYEELVANRKRTATIVTKITNYIGTPGYLLKNNIKILCFIL